MNFYKRFMGDYVRDTAHLTLIEHGAYQVLLDTYYATETPLPAEAASLYRIAGAVTAAEKKAVLSVAQRFFPLNGDGLRHNKRADEEIERWAEQAETNRRIAEERERKRKEQKALNESFNDGETNRARTVEPSHSQKEKPNPPTPLSGGFVRFWEVWPTSSRKAAKGECWNRWRKGKCEDVTEEILRHVEAMKGSHDWRKDGGEFIPAPAVYLKQRRWEGAEIGAEHERGAVV